MSLQDAFSLLTGGGVKFNKKYKRDFDAFKPPSIEPASSDGHAQDTEFDDGCPRVLTSERDDAVRKNYRIKVKGDNVPSPLTSWSNFSSHYEVPQV